MAAASGMPPERAEPRTGDRAEEGSGRRTIGLLAATFITLGTAIDAGTFVAVGPAVEKAGAGLPLALVLAGLVAFATATGGAQLGAAIPRSGGGFTWTRAVGYPTVGFLAGVCFVGKELFTQSVNALTLVVFAQLVLPGLPLHPAGAAAIAAATALNYAGVDITGKILAGLTVVLVVLLLGYSGLLLPADQLTNLQPALGPNPLGLLGGAGVIFFAYAGFERIAVIASTVKRPAHTIPRAIFISFPISALVFLLVGVTTLGVLGSQETAGDIMALPKAFGRVVGDGWLWAVALAALLATATTIIASLLGDSQVVREMGRERELPGWFGQASGERQTPRNAVLGLGLGVAAVTLVFDLRPVLEVANVFTLLWYGAVNFAGIRLGDDRRFAPRAVSWFGLLGCGTLLLTLAWWAILVGLAIPLAAGLARNRLSRGGPPDEVEEGRHT